MPAPLQAIGLILGVLLLAVFASNLADFARAIFGREESRPPKDIRRIMLAVRPPGAQAAQHEHLDADALSKIGESAAAEKPKLALGISRSALARGMLWSFVLEAPRGEQCEDGL